MFGREGVGDVRDARDRHFTPDPLARVIVERLDTYLDAPPSVVIEPSVGGGAFVRQGRRIWPNARFIGVDIDRDAEGLALCDTVYVADWLVIAAEVCFVAKEPIVILGNPPFTGGTAIDHVAACKRAADVVCLILPWSPLGGVEQWEEHMDGEGAPSNAWPIKPRPWPKHIRETAAHLWRSDVDGFDDLGTLVKALPRWKA